jgi:hypothetical protein
LPTNSVIAGSASYMNTLDTQILGSQINIALDPNGHLSSVKSSGASVSACLTNVSRSVAGGTLGYLLGKSCTVFYNWSYSKTKYLTNYSWWIREYTNTNPYYNYYYFYNKTHGSANILGSNNAIIVMAYYDDGFPKIYYYENGVVNQLNTSKNNAWYRYGWSIADDSGHCYYTNYSSLYSEYGFVNNATQVTLNYRIDALKIISGFAVGGGFGIDDLNYTISDSYSGGGTFPGCIDLTGYTQIGHFAYTTYTYNQPYIIKKYHIPVTTTIEAILLECNVQQISDDGDVGNYYAYVNGFSLGNPVCDYITGDEAIFEWDCSINLVDECPVFTFYHSQHTGAGVYWRIATTTFSGGEDLDSDEDTTYYLAGSGFVPSSDYPGSYSASSYGDLGMMWFCTGFSSTTEYEYGDTLGLSYWDYQNTTGYVYDIKNPNGVVCTYTLSTTSHAYTCRIELWKNGTQTNNYGFPQYISYPSGDIIIAPTTIGKYYFKLYSYHYLANITAWVTGTVGNYQIFINPKTSNQFSQYVVTCRYYHPQGLPGYVGVFDDILDVSTYSKAIHAYPISLNTSTDIYYSSNASTPEYWQLFSYSTAYVSVGQYSIHYVRLPFIFENSILVENSPLKLGESTYIRVIHTMPGSDISLYVNGINIGAVGGSQVTRTLYTPSKTGIHNASIRVTQNGTIVTLNYTLFSVTTATGDKPDDGLPGLTKELIPEEYRLYVGIGIIIGLTLLPTILYLSYAVKTQAQINIPPLPITIATIVLAIVGFILTIIWGLMPWYSVFLLLFVLILYLGILIYKKSGSE